MTNISLLVFVMALLTLFIGVGLKYPPDINLKYVGLESSCPRDSKNVSYVGAGVV